MSPSTIGGIIGAGIGFVVGGPAGARWGWMLGGMAGSIISPERYEGPRLDEARVQTSQDGVPLIYGYGTFPCMGNLAWLDEVKEHRHKRKAKGTPEQVDYTYTRSYMIVVCKGEISGYKIIKRNGKIVYDTRTDAELTALGYSSQEIAETRAAQAKFLQIATLYYGTDTQMPDPTMVAVKGAGNVPAYTGIAYIVLKDDETREGETAQFEFVVANCGERHDDNSMLAKLLVTGSPKATGGVVFATATATSHPVFTGLLTATGADLSDASPAYYGGVWAAVNSSGVRYSTDGMATWETGDMSSPGPVAPIVGLSSGWVAIRQNQEVSSVYTAPGIPSEFTNRPSLASTLSDGSAGDAGASSILFNANGQFFLCRMKANRALYRSDTPEGPYVALWDYFKEQLSGRNPNGASIVAWHDMRPLGGDWYAIIDWHFDEAHRRRQIIRSPDLEIWATFDLLVDVPRSESNDQPAQLAVNEFAVVAYTRGGKLWTSANNWAEPIDTGLTQTAGGNDDGVALFGGRRIVEANGLFYCIGSTDTLVVFDPQTLEVSGPIPLPIGSTVGIAVSPAEPSGEPIPDAPGYYIDRQTGLITGPPGTTIDPCEPNLAQLVADQCNRRGVSTIDVSELTYPVTGYRVAAPSTSQRNIQGLQPGYFFSASEFDGVLHFPKRGRNLTFALTHDDFVDRDGDPIQWERTQEPELPRKVTVAYIDPATSYTATTQQAERRSTTVKAEGETTVELAITGQKDWAAQVSDKSIKVSWGESEECTFHVTIDHADLVTGAEGTVPYLDGSTTVVRIERIEDEGLVRMVTARRTRKNLYESNASGAAKPLPRFPGSSIRGATDGLLLNIPILIDSDDRPGIHWAASRMMSGWAGGQFQIIRAGQWVVAGETSDSAAMGALLSPLPYHSGDIDTANVLRIRINDDLESVTFTNLLQERNPLAIVRPDGTAEIVQFQAATETAPGEYELTMLLRNRVNTGASAHATGARVVFLDERVQYATLEPTDIGQTLTYRFVSFGTDPDAAPIQTYDLTTMVSQMEWPVEELAVEQDGDDFSLSWLERERLGTDVFPIRSINWRGYEVSYSYPGGSGSVVVLTPSHTFTIPGATDITFSVAQLNQFTGAGPARTVHIP